MRTRKKKRGFTLVELLIVIAISGVLMAMSAPKYQGIVDKANEMEQRAHVREALNYIDIYNLDAETDIADTVTFSGIDFLGDEFEKVSAKIKVDYAGLTIGKLRLFAEGKAITISEMPSLG
jgi:prepilin-type N-terminal cleavage/methylation domain-containing protein